MKRVTIYLLILLIIFSCNSKNQIAEHKINDRKIVEQNNEEFQQDSSIINEVNENYASRTASDILSIKLSNSKKIWVYNEKNEPWNVYSIVITNEEDESPEMPNVLSNGKEAIFVIDEGDSVSLESNQYFNLINGNLGLCDLDNDNENELFWLVGGASTYHLAILDEVNGELQNTANITGVVSIIQIADAKYLLTNYIRVGPGLTSEINHYKAYQYTTEGIITYDQLPDDVYEYIYADIFSKYEKDPVNFFYLFLFVYNAKPELATNDFIDEYLVKRLKRDGIDPNSDKPKYVSYDWKDAQIYYDIISGKY